MTTATAAPVTGQLLGYARVSTGHQSLDAQTDALTAAGIDPAVWSAQAIKDALNADMQARRGATWPDHITNPGGFLYSRLRRLAWTTPPVPPKGGGYAATRIDQAPAPATLTTAARSRPHPDTVVCITERRPAATAAARAAAKAYFRQHRARKR